MKLLPILAMMPFSLIIIYMMVTQTSSFIYLAGIVVLLFLFLTALYLFFWGLSQLVG